MGGSIQKPSSSHWLARIRANRVGRVILKIVITVFGTSLILLGLFLVPLPGPGWLIVLGGFAVLALEYRWARRIMRFLKGYLDRWTAWVKRQSWTVRLLLGASGLLLLGVLTWLALNTDAGSDAWDSIRGWFT